MKSFFLIISMFCSVGYASCDYTSDGSVDILDIVGMSNCILTIDCFDGSQCDWNADGELNILDILATISCILIGCDLDCAGDWNGDAVIDDCGVCNGGNTDMDECGICFGNGYLNCINETGCATEAVCDASECLVADCFGVCGGDAIIDCYGFCGGTGEFDDCGVCEGDGTGCENITDIDGNTYIAVQIGDQLWMVENLKVTHYNNGDEIPTGLSNSDWSNTTSGAVAVYDNNESNSDTYGRLYNWYAVDDARGICPEGWHVPTDSEFTVLTDYLGGTSIAGGKMKETGTEHWNSPNTGATNESGFTGLPAGDRSNNGGYYYYMGNSGYFWSSSEVSSSSAWYRLLYYNSSDVYRNSDSKQGGFSVRCAGD